MDTIKDLQLAAEKGCKASIAKLEAIFGIEGSGEELRLLREKARREANDPYSLRYNSDRKRGV